MSDQRDDDRAWREVLYWSLALVGLVGLKQVWTTKLRPWIESTWADIEMGNVVQLPIAGTIDEVDGIALAVLALGVVVGLVVAVRRCAKRSGWERR